MTVRERYITVGKLGRTRGVHGDLYVTPMTDFPERFADMTEIHVEVRGEWQRFAIERTSMIAGRPVLKFIGIDTPEEAARLTNLQLAVPAENVVALSEHRHYIFDLIGCSVVDEESGTLLGHIRDVLQYPANDAYVVMTPDGREVLFPAVKAFVRRIDASARTIYVEPGGFFDAPESASAP